jgi:phytoene synthase
MTRRDSTQARAIIAAGSKSFALASALFPAGVRRDAELLYAFCRRADDAIDLATGPEQALRLSQLRAEVARIYADERSDDPLVASFAELMRARSVPRAYPDALLDGMEMDVRGVAYASLRELVRYAYCVAGTVGLMMCHVMGVRHARALRHAAHLGIAMQLTNVARDVLEDWQRARLYIPDDLLARAGAPELRAALGGPFPERARNAAARATAELLDHADAYYRSGDAGLPDLSPRCAFAVRTARLVYAAIGDELRARGCDPLAARAVVPARVKLALAARASLHSLHAWPAHWLEPAACAPIATVIDPTHVLLPWSS